MLRGVELPLAYGFGQLYYQRTVKGGAGSHWWKV